MAHETVEIQILQEKQNKEFITPIQLQLIELLDRNGSMSRRDFCNAFGFETYDTEYTRKYTRTGKRIETKYYDKKIVTQHKQRTTIYDNLIKLQKRKIVEKYSENNGKRGRPLVLWRLKNNN